MYCISIVPQKWSKVCLYFFFFPSTVAPKADLERNLSRGKGCLSASRPLNRLAIWPFIYIFLDLCPVICTHCSLSFPFSPYSLHPIPYPIVSPRFNSLYMTLCFYPTMNKEWFKTKATRHTNKQRRPGTQTNKTHWRGRDAPDLNPIPIPIPMHGLSILSVAF